jgi:hypothetical protein
MAAEVLKSQIFQTGTKFVVSPESEDSVLGAGSVGFMSYVKGRDQDYGNVVYLSFVNTQRGKSGKPRLEAQDLSTPVFILDDKERNSILPDTKRKLFVAGIEPVEFKTNTVMDMTDMDFLGWAFASVRFLRKLNTRSRRISAWPEEDVLLDGFVRLDQHFTEDPDFTRQNFTNPGMRKAFVEKIRVIESTLTKCSLSYASRVAEIEEHAAKTIRSSKLKIASEKVITNTLQFYGNKRKGLSTLYSLKGGGSVSNNTLKSLTKSLSWS